VRYLVLATDYDGTLAHDGVTDAATIAALERFREQGGHPLLVTGREIPDLEQTFPRLDLFARVVAENGGVLYEPATGRERVLGPPADPHFVEMLRRAGVAPLSVGRTIVATVEPFEREALAVIKALGLELHVIFNKGNVMVLPSSVNKATGLHAALDDLDLSPHNTAGIGDAENDHAFLDACELSVAVANAIPALREHVDLVTTGARGAGVQELIDRLLVDPPPFPRRHWLPIGAAGVDVAIEPAGRHLLISDGSGCGALSGALLAQIVRRRYQFCLIDPAGQCEAFPHAIRIGMPHRSPPLEEVMEALQRPDQNVVLSLGGIRKKDQPAFFALLLERVRELRVLTGRPHWLVVDEAHQLLPASSRRTDDLFAGGSAAVALVTRHPGLLSPHVRQQMDAVIAVGDVAPSLTAVLEESGIRATAEALAPGLARLWDLSDGRESTFTMRLADRPRR
jgi:hydroxymethylpyrimidine pyrophosphatase-like HAD family hydrolase